MSRRDVVIVGGVHHGSVLAIADGRHYVVVVQMGHGVQVLPGRDPDADDDAQMIARPVRRAWYVFPGRTDIQFFDVVVDLDPQECGPIVVADAARVAWCSGWTPPQRQPADSDEYVDRLFGDAGAARVTGGGL